MRRIILMVLRLIYVAPYYLYRIWKFGSQKEVDYDAAFAYIQMVTSPVPFSFVFKKEISNIILLKQVIAALGAIPIDRNDIRQSMQVINQMTEEVKKGRNFLIFAEGTRSRKGNELLEFKGGSFKSAQKAKCPIVPCALIDSFVPFDRKSIRPVTVKLYYLPPMYYEEYKDMKTTEIAAEVKHRIEAKIAEELA